MGLAPKIQRTSKFTLKKCSKCGQVFGPESYAPTKSEFYSDGVVPICNDCMDNLIKAHTSDTGVNWQFVNKICQMVDIPFVPAEWVKLADMNEHNVFFRYATIFQQEEYVSLDWTEYNEAYLKLKRENRLDEEIPLIAEDRRRELRLKWGGNYDDEALHYLESLYSGLLATQNVNGSLQKDQALKICKMSYEVDRRIASGQDFDKLLGSYDKLVKTAEFTPKNVKNINDFDSTGELLKWMEKRGWRNNFYDGVTRDVVDETIKNIQSFNQRLYTNESTIADQIEQRIHNLQSTAKMEGYYTSDAMANLDAFEQEGIDNLFENEGEDFQADLTTEINTDDEDY